MVKCLAKIQQKNSSIGITSLQTRQNVVYQVQRAWDVELPFTAPNCVGLFEECRLIAATTKDSSVLNSTGVSDIGRRSLSRRLHISTLQGPHSDGVSC